MFEVPRTDDRLKKKAEVLTLLLAALGQAERRPLALSADFLKKKPLYHVNFAGQELVVVTSPDGANRVYASGGVRFARRDSDGRLRDGRGAAWRLSEDALESEADGTRLPRVPVRRAFWFGWYAQFPDTELVR